jgi:hypothetical protein
MPNKASGVKILPFNTASLGAMGCNATLARDGVMRSLHFAGSDAIRDLIRYCDQRGYKVVTISNPRTIYRDLQGSRAAMADYPGTTHRMGQTNVPEARLLGKRKDLLA